MLNPPWYVHFPACCSSRPSCPSVLGTRSARPYILLRRPHMHYRCPYVEATIGSDGRVDSSVSSISLFVRLGEEFGTVCLKTLFGRQVLSQGWSPKQLESQMLASASKCCGNLMWCVELGPTFSMTLCIRSPSTYGKAEQKRCSLNVKI